MSDRIHAPWTEPQVAALNSFQRSGVMHPFTCGGEHEMHQTLIAERDGWHCPDEQCDYRQTWAHAFMADPRVPDPPRLPGAAEQVAILQRLAQPGLAAELRRTQQHLRETETQLGEERQRTTALAAENADLRQQLAMRVQAELIHEAISRIPAPSAPACGETLYERTIADAGSIDAWQERR